MLSEKSSPLPLPSPAPAPPSPQSDEPPSPSPQSDEPRAPAPQSPQSDEPQSDEEYEESSDSESLNSDDDVTPVKKQKVNEIDLWDGHLSSGEEFIADQGYFFPNFCDDDKMGDLDSWKRYWDQINESEGFDIKENPGSGPMSTIFPMPYHLNFPENVERLEGYASKALEEYNEKHGTKYEVKEILKVNLAGCKDIIYYLTLSVKNGKEEYFQVKVVRHMDQSLEFPIVRPRVKGGSDI